MNGTAPKQPPIIDRDRGTNSNELGQIRKVNATSLFDIHRDAELNTSFSLPAFAVKVEAYIWLTINVVRVVAIAIGVFLEDYCLNSHTVKVCHVIFYLALIALCLSIHRLFAAYQDPSSCSIPIKHGVNHDRIGVFFTKLTYMFVYIMYLLLDAGPLYIIWSDKGWYWDTSILAVLYSIRFAIVIVMGISVLIPELDPEGFMLAKFNSWRERIYRLYARLCNRLRVFGVSGRVGKLIGKLLSCFKRISNMNSKKYHLVDGGGSLGLASQAENKHANNVQKAPSVAGPIGRSKNTSTFNIGDNGGPPIGNTSIALPTGNPNQSAPHTQPCPEQLVNPGPDPQIISTVASSNNGIELTNLCAVNSTDLNEDAVVNTNQDLEDSATNNETENPQDVYK